MSELHTEPRSVSDKIRKSAIIAGIAGAAYFGVQSSEHIAEGFAPLFDGSPSVTEQDSSAPIDYALTAGSLVMLTIAAARRPDPEA